MALRSEVILTSPESWQCLATPLAPKAGTRGQVDIVFSQLGEVCAAEHQRGTTAVFLLERPCTIWKSRVTQVSSDSVEDGTVGQGWIDFAFDSTMK